MPIRRRAFVYITREDAGGLELAVFAQETPGSGIQTPGGTIEPHETPLEGALREAFEETGLSSFGPPRLLARRTFDGPEEQVDCYYVHLPALGDVAGGWEHMVVGDGLDRGMVFGCSWLPVGIARKVVWPHMMFGADLLE